MVASHRARDDSQLLHFLAHALAIADADEDEVRVGGNELQTELTKRVLQVIQAAGVVGAGAGEMCLVVQRRERAGLGDGVDVERLADLFQRGNQFRVSDAVTQPQSSQAEDFGERPHQQKVRLFSGAKQRQQINRFFEKVDIGFVHHQQHTLGDLVCQPDDLFRRRECARGVVRIGNEGHFRAGRDGFEHRGQVVSEIRGGNGNQLRAEQVCDDGVNREAILRYNHFGARLHQRVSDELDDFIGAVAEDQVVRLDTEFRCQLLLQVKRVAVRIEVQVPQGFFHRGQGGG